MRKDAYDAKDPYDPYDPYDTFDNFSEITSEVYRMDPKNTFEIF